MRVNLEINPISGQLDTTVRDQTGMPVGAITHMSTQMTYGGLHTVSLVINLLDTTTAARCYNRCSVGCSTQNHHSPLTSLDD